MISALCNDSAVRPAFAEACRPAVAIACAAAQWMMFVQGDSDDDLTVDLVPFAVDSCHSVRRCPDFILAESLLRMLYGVFV